MTELKTVDYVDVVRVLMEHGFLMVDRDKGHVRLHRETQDGQVRIIVPESNAVKPETLSQIIRYSGLSINEFGKILV